MGTQRLQNSYLGQINLLTIQEVAEWLGNRTYRFPEKSIIAYRKEIGYDHLRE